MYVEEQEDVPWDTLNVIVADVTYGGRVTDVWDKRTIASIMRLYFDPGVLDDSYRFRYTTFTYTYIWVFFLLCGLIMSDGRCTLLCGAWVEELLLVFHELSVRMSIAT